MEAIKVYELLQKEYDRMHEELLKEKTGSDNWNFIDGVLEGILLSKAILTDNSDIDLKMEFMKKKKVA